jgi:hypothetical protein
MSERGEIDQIVIARHKIHEAQAFALADRLIAARDPVTGLLPLNIKTEQRKLAAADHKASGLDMGRATSGLVMLSQIARTESADARSDKYLKAAERNYDRGKKLLAERAYFVHLRDFDDQGRPVSSAIGEPGKSAEGEDNMSRVNSRAYALRAAGDLYRVTHKESYRRDFEQYVKAWIRDFHDPMDGGFFIHANVMDPSDHKEIGTFKDPGGVDSEYEGWRGVKGNDGTVYVLSSVLLLANEILGTEQTQDLVREQLDIILRRFRRQNGMLWENYTNDWKPISMDWQNQPMDAAKGQDARTSHVAVGGHTAMAPQQIIEGARQLLKQGRIDAAQYFSYIDQSVSLFQPFATDSGAVDWDTGAVHNAILVEEERSEHRWLQGWGDAGWQQAELIQTLLRFAEEGRLRDIHGPKGKSGEELLELSEQYYVTKYPVPAEYFFDGFANPDVYHRPQLAYYHNEVMRNLKARTSGQE